MPEGDVVFRSCAIELKNMGDAISDIKSRQLKEKLKKIRRKFKSCHLFLALDAKPESYSENPFDNCTFMHLSDYTNNTHFIHGAFNSFVERYGVSIQWFDNEEDQMWSVVNLFSKHIQGPANIYEEGFKTVVKTGTVSVDMLMRIPGIGLPKAQSIMEYFGTIEELAKASVEKIREVDGIGLTLADNVYNALHAEHEIKRKKKIKKKFKRPTK